MSFSETYFRLFEETPTFHDRVAQKYSLDSEQTAISERLLRCIWYDRLYDDQRLATVDGKPVTVYSPGTWNLEGGPDFKRADIFVGEDRLRGDVELHLESAGWRLHGHPLDPNYDNVILHVILSTRARKDPPLSRRGAEISEVALWDYLTDDLALLKCKLRPDEYPYSSQQNFGKCQSLLAAMAPETVQSLLCIAGDARMIAKYRRFSYEAEKHDLDQVAYAAIMEGMGYKAHTKQFGQLARKLSYARLRERVLSVHTDSNDQATSLTQALLLGVAGLIPHPDDTNSTEARDYCIRLNRLWNEYGFGNMRGDDISWKTAAVRPANLPQRRIAGAGHILNRSFNDGLFVSIMNNILNGAPKEARRNCVEFLTPGEDEFWSYRYSAAGKFLPKPVSLIGQDRAMTIVVNSFVPLGLLHARTEECDEKEGIVHRFYCRLPSLSANNLTRLMEYRMFGSEPKQKTARSARTQQGLLQIFADWCSEDPSCESCGILTGLQSGNVQDKLSVT